MRLAITCLLNSVAFPFAIRTENPADSRFQDRCPGKLR